MRIMISSYLNLKVTFFIMTKLETILERYPYRYVKVGMLDNGHPDYRIQKYNDWTKRYKDMYLLDNSIQLDYVIEDFEYTKWLDPDPEVGAYIKMLVASMETPRTRCVSSRCGRTRCTREISINPICTSTHYILLAVI